MKKITFLCFLIFTITLQGQDKLLSSIDEYFNGVSWETRYGANYEYDASNNLISETELYWNSDTNSWENSYKITYTYNGDNKVTQELDQDWNSITNQFEYSYRVTNTYTNGVITEIVGEIWQNGGFENEFRSVYTYSNGKVTEAISYDWGTQWDKSDKSIITYNANNRVEKIDINDWDGSNWVVGDRDLFSYDMNGKIDVKTYETWDGSNWGEEEKIEFVIDANGNKTKETVTYDGNSYVEDYTYDLGELMSNYVHPFQDQTGFDYITVDNPFYNKLLSYTSGTSNRTTYDYNNAITLSTEDVKVVDNVVKVFPNPTSGDVNIKSSKHNINHVEIYNTLGSRVFSTQKKQFNIDFLNTGVYFLSIKSSDGAVVTRKILKN